MRGSLRFHCITLLLVSLVACSPSPSPVPATTPPPVAIATATASLIAVESSSATPSTVPSIASVTPPLPTPSKPPPWKPVHCHGTLPDDNASPVVPSDTSPTWSGYVNAKTNGKLVTCVEGGWTVPTVVCARKGAPQDLSIWVGIGGWEVPLLGRSSLEQVGVEAYCPRPGPANYLIWHETWPREPRAVPFPAYPGFVHPGSHVWAQVLYAAGAFTMTIANLDTGVPYAITEAVPGARRVSAEWIVEAPTQCPAGRCGTTPFPLANFRSVTFDHCFAVIGGHSASISDRSRVRWRLDMVRTRVTRARTGGLQDAGRRFTVHWVRA